MDVHFAETRHAAAPARILFEVVTDYAGYPGFHSALMHVAVYAGVPAANSAFALAKTILASDSERQPQGDSSR